MSFFDVFCDNLNFFAQGVLFYFSLFVFWIWISFSTDPYLDSDLAFYLNTDSAQGSHTNEDPDPDQDLLSSTQRMNFLVFALL